MKTQRIIALLLVLALIVALEVVMMSRCTRGDSAALPSASPAPSGGQEQPQSSPDLSVATALPTVPGYTSPPGNTGGTPTQPPATDPPATSRPTATPAPTQAPTPTPAPTEPPEGSVGSTISSGSFSSNTGTSLNLSVSWSAKNIGDGIARLTITGTVSSYELNVTGLPVSISFGGRSVSVTGSSIKVSGNGLASNSLFSTTMDVALDTEDTMTVSWKYNGKYGDLSLSEITASGYVYT